MKTGGYGGLILEITVEEAEDGGVTISTFSETVDLQRQGTDKENEIMDKIKDFVRGLKD